MGDLSAKKLLFTRLWEKSPLEERKLGSSTPEDARWFICSGLGAIGRKIWLEVTGVARGSDEGYPSEDAKCDKRVGLTLEASSRGTVRGL